MSTGRFHHAATLLANGKVLVASGVGTSAPVASAELYDPVSNSWSSAGSLSAARDGHTATRLGNGKVLVTGGVHRSGPVASAELYDPASNSRSPAASMSTGRTLHTATPLADGRVLVAGGSLSSTPTASAELYTPATSASVLAGDFGDGTVGQRSAIEYLPVTDTGDEPLFVTGTGVTGPNAADFSVAYDGCTNAPVNPGATCWLGLRFTPTAAGARSATLTVADNGQANSQTAPLVGNGVAANAGPVGPAGPAGTNGANGPAGPNAPPHHPPHPHLGSRQSWADCCFSCNGGSAAPTRAAPTASRASRASVSNRTRGSVYSLRTALATEPAKLTVTRSQSSRAIGEPPVSRQGRVHRRREGTSR